MLVEDENGNEADYEEVRGGFVALFKKPKVRARDDYNMLMVFQCSTYCVMQDLGLDSILQLQITQWSNGIKIKEDTKVINISSDVRKQV